MIHKKTLILKSTPLDIPHSIFSLLKYLEYFLLFLIVRANLKRLKQSKVFVVIFLLTALLTAIYSNIFIQQQLATGEAFFRVAPPVETRGGGEANSLAGYMLFMMAIAGGLLLSTRSAAKRIFLICLMILMFRGFLYSLSRGSYLAFLPMLLTLFFFSKKATLGGLLIIFLVMTAPFMPNLIKQRVLTTIIPKQSEKGLYLELEESPRARIDSWNIVLTKRFPTSPLLGHGVGNYFVDGQLFLTLCEVGIVGLILLVWVLARLFKLARNVFNMEAIKNDEFSKGLSIGFLSGFVGLLFQSISTNTFIIIRIMEPFWFMAAIILSLPQLLKEEEEVA